ncbi:hypothetical protein [Paenibacillus naphthalenovorans]|uniref:hypothetical protein n=1 Tax=Paenibacillus naphthalenovorans TaxID=162209 RepID=UPI003D2BAA85
MIDSQVIRKIRAVYRLSLREMGALLSVSESHLCRIEKNERIITPTIRSNLIQEFALDDSKLVRILALYDEFTVKGAVTG